MELCKYPNQIAVVKRKNITLGLDALLFPAGSIRNNKGEEIVLPPLSMHSPMSCFKWTLIDKSRAETIYPEANIPCKDVGTFKRKVDAVIADATTSNTVEKKSAESPAYTTKILVSKSFRGKTPASILLENEENLEQLLQTAEFLREHCDDSKYSEGNKQQIQAIEEAVELFRADKLSADQIQNESIVIYHQPSKTLTSRPAIEIDHFFTYSFKIEYLKSYTYPWQISIENFYVKIKKKPNGMREAIPGTAIKRAKSQIQITDYEMGYLVDRLYSTMQYFEMIYFKRQYERAIELYEKLKNSFQSDAA